MQPAGTNGLECPNRWPSTTTDMLHSQSGIIGLGIDGCRRARGMGICNLHSTHLPELSANLPYWPTGRLPVALYLIDLSICGGDLIPI